ncbi:MAG: endonuclease/exonuclease/phosphatase family protein [Patescibacteria group bacterium]
MQIKILQWNIFYKEKIENVIRLLKEIDPDIFCLQELAINCKFNKKISDISLYIAQELKANYYFERAFTKTDTSEMEAIGNGIFSKYPIVRKDSFFTQKPASVQKSYSDEGRVCVEADIQINGTVLTVATVHLSYVHKFFISKQKKREVNILIEKIKNKKEKYVITGDLNSTPDSYTICELSKHLVHCGPDFKESTWTTKLFDYQGFREDKLNWRLDYVFATKDVKVVSSKILKTDTSDHLPILTTILI